MRKSFRVKTEDDFQKVFNHHDSVANKYFVLYQLPKKNQKHFRLGVSVGKKVGKAHDRVWVKRRIRQSMTELKDDLLKPETDILIIARPNVAKKDFFFIKKQIIGVLKKAELIDENY